MPDKFIIFFFGVPEIKRKREKPIAMSRVTKVKPILCSAPESQERANCPVEKCAWVEGYDICAPKGLATEKHWGDNGMSRAAENYIRRVDDLLEQRELAREQEEEEDPNWWARKSYAANMANPKYSDGSPRGVAPSSVGRHVVGYQQYLRAAFTGQSHGEEGRSTGIKEGTHDWRSRLESMSESQESAACRGVKGLAPYQAVSERLAMTAKLDGARGFLAFHSVGSGKTITSASCIDVFLGGEDRDEWDLYFITTADNLAQSAEMMEEIPLISWRDRWSALREEKSARKRSSAVLRELGLKFSDSGKTDKRTRASYFAQKYDDFSTAINATDVRQRMRRAGRSLQAYGGEAGSSYFADGDDHRPIIRGGSPARGRERQLSPTSRLCHHDGRGAKHSDTQRSRSN